MLDSLLSATGCILLRKETQAYPCMFDFKIRYFAPVGRKIMRSQSGLDSSMRDSPDIHRVVHHTSGGSWIPGTSGWQRAMPASPPAHPGFLELDLSSASNQRSSGNVFAAAHGGSRVNATPRHSSTAFWGDPGRNRGRRGGIPCSFDPFSSSSQCQVSTGM